MELVTATSKTVNYKLFFTKQKGCWYQRISAPEISDQVLQMLKKGKKAPQLCFLPEALNCRDYRAQLAGVGSPVLSGMYFGF